MSKRILSVVLTLALIFTLSISAFASPKGSTQTVKFEAVDVFGAEATVSVTNVTSQATKDMSVSFIENGKKQSFEGKNSKVVYCNAPTTVTLVSSENYSEEKCSYGFIMRSSDTTAVLMSFKYYEVNADTGELGNKKLTKPTEYFVIADGSSYTMTQPGTYVVYVIPYLMEGELDVDYKLTPMFIVVGNGSTVAKDTKVTSISLNKTSLSLAKGKSATLTATVKPTNVTNKAVTWTSSNTKVATVDSKGKVTAKAKGTATITCKAADGSGKTATCKITVK